MSSMSIKEKYSPAAWALYEYRITAGDIAANRNPAKSRIGISFELTGRSPLTEETCVAIRELSNGNAELVETVKLRARDSFIERNPHRPERHAWRPRREAT